MAKCSSVNCRAEIEWGKLKGKPHPFDPPEPCPTCNGKGYIVIYGSVPDQEICDKCGGTGQIQKSHFASCVDAPAFRSRGS